jgi:hypothetical protein
VTCDVRSSYCPINVDDDESREVGGGHRPKERTQLDGREFDAGCERVGGGASVVAWAVESEGEDVGSRVQIRQRWRKNEGRREGCWRHIELPRYVTIFVEDGDVGGVLPRVEEDKHGCERAPAQDHRCSIELRVQRAGIRRSDRQMTNEQA